VKVPDVVGVNGRVAPRVEDVLAVAVERQVELERGCICFVMFSTAINVTSPRLFATGSSSASTWKLSHHIPTLSLESISLHPT
jgi:hypothetical protein